MLLGILVPTVLLCIGTKIFKVNDCVDGNVQLDFTKTQAQESGRMTKIVMPVCFPHIDGGNYLRSPARILRLPPLHIYAYLPSHCHLTLMIELNLGPDYPCGCCGSEVLETDMAIERDNCCNWFHISCQGIGENSYDTLTLESSFSWICSICSETNFSHSTSSLASVTSPNHFSVLSDETSQTPTIQRPKLGRVKAQKAVKILNVNCQSVANKKAEFFSLLDHHNPDIVIGTESWLSSNHLDSEIFPKSLGYTSFRKDRCSETHGGGVFILVRNSFVATEQRELSTDCEIIWVKLEPEGCKALYIASYYRPHEDDLHSFEELKVH